jgi:hypothetical protein
MVSACSYKAQDGSVNRCIGGKKKFLAIALHKKQPEKELRSDYEHVLVKANDEKNKLKMEPPEDPKQLF